MNSKVLSAGFRWSLVNNNPAFSVLCADCGHSISTDEDKIADLNGEAYKAYYHRKCAWSMNNFKPLGI